MPPTVGFDWSHIYNHKNLNNIRVVSHKGKVVSSVGIFPSTVRTPRGSISVGGINNFLTHPNYQRHGLGSAVLRDAHQKMRADGHHIGLLVTVIPDYYRKFGWDSAGRQLSFIFDRDNIEFLPEPTGFEITKEWEPYAKQLRALHDEESYVALRSQDLFNLLLERRAERLFVAVCDGRAVAYAAVSGWRVVEYGGEADTVAGLLRGVFTKLDDPDARTSEPKPDQRQATIDIKVKTPDSGEGLPGLLRNLGIPSTLGNIGMILILNAPGLFEALGIENVLLQRRDGGWRLTHGSKTLVVTERELVKMVFGPERFPDFAQDVFPVDFYQWNLDMV